MNDEITEDARKKADILLDVLTRILQTPEIGRSQNILKILSELEPSLNYIKTIYARKSYLDYLKVRELSLDAWDNLYKKIESEEESQEDVVGSISNENITDFFSDVGGFLWIPFLLLLGVLNEYTGSLIEALVIDIVLVCLTPIFFLKLNKDKRLQSAKNKLAEIEKLREEMDKSKESLSNIQ